MANFSPNSVNLMPPPPPPQQKQPGRGGLSAADLKKDFDKVASRGDYNAAKKAYESMRSTINAVSGDDDEKAEILADAQRKLAALMHTLPGDFPLPMPLPIRITANDATKADPNAMPDNLKATMSNADPEKNPPQ